MLHTRMVHLTHRRQILFGVPALILAQGAGVGAVEALLQPATIYVSKSATNGFAAGSDDHTLAEAMAADRQTPFRTIARAVAARTGDERIVINSGTYAGAELGARNAVVVEAAGISLAAHEPGNVTLVGSDTDAIIRIGGVGEGATVTLSGIVLDGDGRTESCILAADDAPLHTLIVESCRMTGAARRAISINCPRIDLRLSENRCDKTPALLRASRLAAPSRIAISGGRTRTTATESGRGAIDVRAVEPGVAFSCSAHGLAVGLDASLAGRGNHYGIIAHSVSRVAITGNRITLTGTPGARLGCPVRVYADAPLPVTGPIVSGNSIANLGRGGFGIAIGNDAPGPGDGWVTDPVVTDNQVFGLPARQTSALHGILLARTQGGNVLRNDITGCALALIEKLNTGRGALFALNTVRLTAFAGVGYSIAMYAKGSFETRFVHNSIHIADDSGNPVYVAHVRSDPGAAETRGALYANNAIHFTGNAALRFVNVEGASAARFTHNLWFSATPLPPDAFRTREARYATVTDWAAIEPGAAAGDPRFAAPAEGDFTLRPGSAAIGAGSPIADVTTDRAGRPFDTPPAIGAYEAGTPPR